MLQELQGIILCRDSLQVRRRWGASILRPRPLEERRARAATATAGPLSHKLAQEAALVVSWSSPGQPPFVYTRTPVDYQRRLDLPSLKQTDNPVILELKVTL
ncbi:hypothetical protein NHX12_016814 [Muraenolepis orangiensis]|uniref:Uncharacterized protein n=1 Tax=Muraenolepis orangiensis TaxID=630683 RepID=A0A9Q0D7D6_9TELE|nr:hypothetical protein NHX12_016814 [Muraenolepis orangiensis]